MNEMLPVSLQDVDTNFGWTPVEQDSRKANSHLCSSSLLFSFVFSFFSPCCLRSPLPSPPPSGVHVFASSSLHFLCPRPLRSFLFNIPSFAYSLMFLTCSVHQVHFSSLAFVLQYGSSEFSCVLLCSTTDKSGLQWYCTCEHTLQ